ncbi:sulfur carrier protein ThiS [Aquamicrobium sp. LC103]|uniref:sulfur carrier protein ThiS n=1 Tax=Aquamicrobium sp. LC103 TaxID=1120658 RepID=UPI00063E7D9C|nr:sulfur carrier protein ThiS [Aquamicrobium sp. LC103]TKT77645.1 sulfur carrier protein ThiS [Aquamicrobium sp. LC103]
MRLIVNGNALEAEADTLDGLLGELGYEGNWYATAVNGEFVPGRERAQARLDEGDRVEILSPMKGG